MWTGGLARWCDKTIYEGLKGNDGSVRGQKSSSSNGGGKGQDEQNSNKVMYESYQKHGEDSGCEGQQRHKWSDLEYQGTQRGRLQMG